MASNECKIEKQVYMKSKLCSSNFREMNSHEDLSKDSVWESLRTFILKKSLGQAMVNK